MEIFKTVLMYASLVIAIAAFVFLVLKIRKIARLVSLDILDKIKERRTILILSGTFAIFFTLFCVGIALAADMSLLPLEWFYVILGGLGTGVSIPIFYLSFRLHYYQKNLEIKIDKILYWSMLGSFLGLFIFFTILTQGYALHLSYPLSNGLSWSDGLHLVNIYSGHANLSWYALFIVGGAIFVYFLCDHTLYKEYGKHGLLESTFYVAFPAGIIGARIAYVIGNWNVEFANRELWHIFAIWEGGITILGGAIFGIVAGALWFKWRHKDLDVFKIADIVVPTILLAQAIGRWGNFFNAEVHGGQVMVDYWRFLPEFILQQARYSSTSGIAASGKIWAPLFWVEGVVNVTGFFVLAYLFGKLLKKYTKPGDLVAGYVIWYGATRVFMEPLRDSSFNMGTDGMWSWIWSIVFVGVGILMIVSNHLVRTLIEKHKGTSPAILNASSYKRQNIITLVIIAVFSLTLIGLGFGLYLNNPAPTVSLIALVPHNIGLIAIILGFFAFVSISLPIVNLINLTRK